LEGDLDVSELTHDLRASLRSFRRRPFYPLVTISILAIGISATVAVFTYLTNFYRPFPGVTTDGLVQVFGVDAEEPYRDIAYLDYLDYAESAESFASMAAVQPYYAASVRHATMTEVAFLEAVTGSYFAVLEIGTIIGREIRPADDVEGADPVAVISHDWWHRSFQGADDVLGQTLFLNNRPFTVIGVTAADFLGSGSDYRPDVWIPIAPFKDRYTTWAARSQDRQVPLVRVFGRLAAASSGSQASAVLDTLAAGLDEAHPLEDGPRRLRVETPTWIDPNIRRAEMPTVRLMMAAAIALLVLTCANVANLLLTITMGRQQELGMRAALGASPGRLTRQIFTENLLLSGLAGILAVAIAGPMSTRLGSYFARPSVWGANVPREVPVDWQVLVFAVAISLLTGFLAGLLPAWRASRGNLSAMLASDGIDASRGRRRLLGWRLPHANELLVSVQVALAVVLVVISGLVLRTLNVASHLDPGFDYESMVASYVSTSSTGVATEDRERWFRNLAARLEEEPWVAAATIADRAPLSAQGSVDLILGGHPEPVSLAFSRVNPGFFETLKIGLIRGRTLQSTDTADSLDVAVVNRELVRRFYAGQEPIGQRIRWPASADGEDRTFEIVGVVADAKHQDFIADAPPTVYFSYPQHQYPSGSALILSTTIDPAASIPMLYKWLRSFEPYVAIVNILPYTQVVHGILFTQRMNAELFAVLALLALAIAAVGLFSVVSLAVSRRTREVGIRMSMGARRADIGRLVLARAMAPVAVGLGIGLATALAASRLVRSLLLGVEPTDPPTMIAGALVLVVVTLVAATLPAYRAAAADPMVALRGE
jgi:predicted permease